MFVKGNTKLGTDVWVFSIPAKKTCPGASPKCAAVCYAAAGNYNWASVKRSHRANLAAARRPDFAARALAEVRARRMERVRVHAAGDFFSVPYAAAWLEVMRGAPHVRFWFYTRSWRRAPFRPVFRAMAALPNVRVWFSADAATGVPRRVPRRVRVAWLMTAPDEAPPVPVALVFRTKPLTTVPALSVRGAPVCPTETGRPGAKGVTCQTCRVCARPLPGDPRRRALPVLA